MKITLNKIDEVNATLNIEIVKEDYEEKVKHSMKEISKTVSIPGFRKGMVPVALLQKTYGKAVLAEELNKLVSNKITDYIKENDLDIIAEPLPRKDNNQTLDFLNQENYEFVFDIALKPEINVDLTKEDKLPYYTITVDDELIEKQINYYKSANGSQVQVEDIESNDIAKGLLTELNEENLPKDGGISIENVTVMPSYISSETERNMFIGAKLGDTIIFNPSQAYQNNETELSSFMKIKKEEVKDHQGNFSFEIKEISRYKEAELNQQLYDKLYEEGSVVNEEQFRDKVKETVAGQLESESDYRLSLDIKKLIEEKIQDIPFPYDFLKRFLEESKEQTKESLDENFPKIITDLKVRLFKNKIAKENNVRVTNEEVMGMAMNVTRIQFSQYGIPNIPDNILENYAKEMLKKEGSEQNMVDRVTDEKLFSIFKEKVTLENKEITKEEFKKLFED
ncbi:MAG: trigger factor [Dysgonamonadaceae bacterium]|jgi:trigger factor|nr:trigger factor [Dysgonamonadaceae bacterium]